MPFAFAHHADAAGGVFTRREARSWGMTDNELQRSVRSGMIKRLGYGVYAHGDLPDTREGRHAAIVRGVVRGRPRSWASARSALALHDLPLIHSDLDTVILCAPGRERYHRPGVVTYPVPEGEPVGAVAGVPSVSLETAIFQTVGRDRLSTAIIAADAALHRGLTTIEALDERRATLRRLAPRSQRVLDAVDASAESPGESLGRILIRGLGYRVQSQVEIRTPAGELIGRVDLLIDGVIIVEFDGDVKYGGERGQRALVAEKRREDRLRAMGYVVVRLTWSDLFTRGRLERILAEAVRQARLLRPAAG
ncbi:MAG: hypothetical protein WCA30_08650 [Dermatophilaceae bacterium]